MECPKWSKDEGKYVFEQKQDLVDEISDKVSTMSTDDLEQILELVDELQEEQTKQMIARLKEKKI
tara:strand:- start:307 stop:501 length:195 start_codon:yes stop_codon:yes gene_type:complete